MFVVLSQLVYPADVQDDDPETLGAELPIQGLPSILVKVGLLGDQEDWFAGQLGHPLESFERLPGVLPKDGNGELAAEVPGDPAGNGSTAGPGLVPQVEVPGLPVEELLLSGG